MEGEYVTVADLATQAGVTKDAIRHFAAYHGWSMAYLPNYEQVVSAEDAATYLRQHATNVGRYEGRYVKRNADASGIGYVDMTGQKVNRWTFVEFHGTNSGGQALWLCRCDCGTEKVLAAIHVRHGTTQSCGCLRRETSRANLSAWIAEHPEYPRQTGLSNKGRRHYKEMVPARLIICKGCNSMFLTQEGASKKRRESHTFCSTECWYNYIRRHPDEHPNWKGGFQPYYGPVWDRQAAEARKRDNNTCQECGKHQTRPRLQVHHRKALRDFESWEEANQLDNLVTLCKRCHKKADCRLDKERRAQSESSAARPPNAG